MAESHSCSALGLSEDISFSVLRRTRSFSDIRSLNSLPPNYHEKQESSHHAMEFRPKSLPVLGNKDCDLETTPNTSETTTTSALLDGRAIESLTIQALKDELGKRNLSKRGNKQILVTRLKSSIEKSSQKTTAALEQSKSVCIDLDATIDTKRGDQEHSGCSELIKTAIHEVSENFRHEIDKLRHEFSGHRILNPPLTETAEVTSLQNENRDLKRRLRDLEERYDSLKREANAVNDENKSLITALRLLNNEIEKESKHNSQETNEGNLYVKESSWETVGERTKKRNKGPCGKKAEESTSTANHTESDRNQSQTNRQKEIIIAGDSILKNLQGHKLSRNSRVKISSFPGCTTLDMKDHVKPLLRRNPDEIILHVGTNSLRSCKSARACAEEIVDLASMVGTESTAKITISSLVGRSDDETLASKITDVNKVIKQFCNQNNWGFVDHSNISVNSHLNRSGLHLNKSGTSRLARNLINHLNLE